MNIPITIEKKTFIGLSGISHGLSETRIVVYYVRACVFRSDVDALPYTGIELMRTNEKGNKYTNCMTIERWVLVVVKGITYILYTFIRPYKFAIHTTTARFARIQRTLM